MTWRRVGAIYAALAALALAFVLLERAPERTPAPDDPRRPERSLLGTEPERVRGLVLRRDGRTVEARRNGERWQVVAPPGAEVPPDLIAATVATLTAGQVAEVMNDGARADLTTFGLTAPTSEIEVTIDGDTPRRVRVLLGARNPTRTAIYAKRDDAPAVYLVGLNVRYYEDLIFEAIATAAPP
jgi:hypothetical protein